MALAQEKVDKLNELILNVYRMFSVESVSDLLEYNLSSDFESEEDIINSIPYINVLLFNSSIKERCLNNYAWVNWAKARKKYVVQNEDREEMYRTERDRIIRELNLFEVMLDKFPEILKNKLQTSIVNCIEEINYMLHKGDSTIYVNVELDNNKLIAEIICGELETKSSVEQIIKEAVLRILQLGPHSPERPAVCTTITMIV